jgi:hypothetical protein
MAGQETNLREAIESVARMHLSFIERRTGVPYLLGFEHALEH